MLAIEHTSSENASATRLSKRAPLVGAEKVGRGVTVYKPGLSTSQEFFEEREILARLQGPGRSRCGVGERSGSQRSDVSIAVQEHTRWRGLRADERELA